MDPNATLQRIRDIIATIDRHGLEYDAEELVIEFVGLYQYVKNLDEWLTSKEKGGKGGLLPNDWD